MTLEEYARIKNLLREFVKLSGAETKHNSEEQINELLHLRCLMALRQTYSESVHGWIPTPTEKPPEVSP